MVGRGTCEGVSSGPYGRLADALFAKIFLQS
jgi:hypothetical protein